MLLDERKEDILDFLVRDYVRTAEPVSSLRVREGLGLNESSATIRNIMAELSEEGFFEQPHISAGRVPTDLAYRYFVDNLMSRAFRGSFPKTADSFDEAEAISRFFSETLNLLSFSSRAGSRFLGRGFSELLEEPEFSDAELVRNLGHLADNIDETAQLYRECLKDDSDVFIGEENPVRQAKELSVFYAEAKRGKNKSAIMLISPKRVNYEKVSNCINRFFKEF